MNDRLLKTMKYLCTPLLLMLALGGATQTTIYGLEFSDLPSDPDQPSPVCWGQLKFVQADMSSGEIEIVNSTALSNGCHQSGVSDFDPFDKRYFYTNENKVLIINALNGELLDTHELSDYPISPNKLPTNIAYNWLDELLYGLMQDYVEMEDGNWDFELTPFSLDPISGELVYLRDTPLESGSYFSGNSDIDIITREYVFVDHTYISRIDLDTGDEVRTEIVPPEGSTIDDSVINIAFDWVTGEWYGLFHIYGFDDPEELRLVRLVDDGTIEIISEEPLLFESFLFSNSDIDALVGKYFFIADDIVHQIDVVTGDVLSAVELMGSDSVINPFLNMGFDDLAVMPDAPIAMDLGGPEFLNPDEPYVMNVWMGDNITYEWSDGWIGSERLITEPGTYEVMIERAGLEFFGTKTFSVPTDLKESEFRPSIFPNPTAGELRIDGNGLAITDLRLLDTNGRSLPLMLSSTGRYDLDVVPGTYILQVISELSTAQYVIIVDY